jgi:hypothetical protein
VNSSLQRIAHIAERLGLTSGPANALSSAVPPQLAELYGIGDGFFSYDRSLLVRPICREAEPEGAVQWNGHDFWTVYFDSSEKFFVFAEDSFGDPFCFMGNNIVKINMETGECMIIADTVEEWASLILYDPNLYLNTAIMMEWVKEFGSVPAGFRLAPKIPFILGGEYCLDNIALLAENDLAVFRSQLASQIKNLPDGANIELSIE